MRYLLINADDFGIGPGTSQGILQLGAAGRITSSVILSNSPHAESAVALWRKSLSTLELGWHPTLTLDRPVLPAGRVASLVDEEGNFFPLMPFLKRLMRKQVVHEEIHAELTAQYRRCCELLQNPPIIINTHHHIQIFPPIGAILRDIVASQAVVPYVRLVREPWPMLFRVGGARVKRLVLNTFGRREARRQRSAGMLGNDWLIGVTDNGDVNDPEFFTRWISRVPGNVVELTCHPGLMDTTLIGRDCTATDGMVERRPRELELLSAPGFLAAVEKAGFTLIAPSHLRALYHGDRSHAA